MSPTNVSVEIALIGIDVSLYLLVVDGMNRPISICAIPPKKVTKKTDERIAFHQESVNHGRHHPTMIASVPPTSQLSRSVTSYTVRAVRNACAW